MFDDHLAQELPEVRSDGGHRVGAAAGRALDPDGAPKLLIGGTEPERGAFRCASSVPPVLKPVRTNFGTDYHEMTQKVATQEILPGLDTEVWGYDGVFPGPTIRVLGGAMARVSADATAFAHRTSRIMVNVAALYERPDEAAVHEDWITGFAAVLRQGDGGAYVNFLGDEGEARIRAAYPESTWERLAEIKGRYDPTNLFRLNQNIPPRHVATGTDTRASPRVRHA